MTARGRSINLWASADAAKRTRRAFATVKEAVAALAASKAIGATRKAVRKAARRALPPEERRARDVQTYGGACAKDREVSQRLAAAWTELTGFDAIVLNDGTRADVLLALGPGDDAYLNVQVKAANEMAVNEEKRNMWIFQHVTKYPDMAVVFWRLDHSDGWAYDGAALAARGKINMHVTPGGVNARLALAAAPEAAHALLGRLWTVAGRDLWPTTTEDAAHRDFESGSHNKEFEGIEAYKAWVRGTPGGAATRFAWPDEQNSHVDQLQDDRRLQFKTACAVAGRSGFLCHLFTSAGTSADGKQLKAPYAADAFDVLVIVAWPDAATPCFWQIPASDLQAHGYLRDASTPGKQSLIVHGPEGVGRAPKYADTWTRAYFCR